MRRLPYVLRLLLLGGATAAVPVVFVILAFGVVPANTSSSIVTSVLGFIGIIAVIIAWFVVWDWLFAWPRHRWTQFRERMSTNLQAKLMVSHVIVVVLSMFVFSFLGFLLYLFLLNESGYDPTFDEQVQSIIALTIFTLVMIAVIAACSIFVAFFATRYMANRLTRQIDELVLATDRMAAGHLDTRVRVLSDDELGSMAERFNAFAARLEELDSQRKSFVANVSHDLRTPIAIIRGHVDSQTREPDDETPTPDAAFHAIDHEIGTLSRLVDDLFTLSRLEEAALPMDHVPVALDEIIREAVNGIRPYALKGSRVSVHDQIEPSLPEVVGDRMRLTQVLNNLLHNAVRHTPEGGIVMVHAESDRTRGVVRMAVSDTGVGIPAEKLQKIFERFYQGESRREGGSGLGLSIVKQLVDAHGGTVDVESEEGVGTTFTITLPLARQAAELPLSRGGSAA